MRAQAWSLDFAASVVIFLTALILIMFAMNYTLSQSRQQSEMDMMESLAMSASDTLVRQPGIPEAWNSTNVTTIGLASQENILNETKLAEFISMDYSRTKGLLGIANYEFYFEVRYPDGSLASLPGGGLAAKGTYPSGASIIIPADRNVIYMDKPASATLILWD